jgi:hypothetical protein
VKVLFNALVSVFVCTCLTSALHAQVSDNFSDFDLTINPEWTGNLVDFTTNVEGKLQLNQTVAGQSFLVTSFAETSINNKEWQILVKQTFSGSDNNQSRIYLSFSGSDLSYSGNNGADGQGYFLRLGEGGSLDAVKLFRNDNSSSAGVLIAEGSAGQIATSFEIRIKVVRDDLGNWEIWVAEDGGLVFLPQGSGFDDTYSLATSLGMVCTYTTTNADNFFFDDIYCGEPIIDNDPPEIASASVLDATMVDVFFSEPVEPTSAELAANYLIGASGTITSAMLDDSDPTLVHLELTDELPANTEVLLNVSNISDFSGNVQGADNIAILWFVPQPPEWKSVIFNEVFADPTPSLGLPEAEYLELYNRSEVSFDLAGWQLTNSGLAKVLPSFVLDPGDFVILCAETNVAALSAYGEVISIPSFSALSNDGDNLALYFTDNTLIDVLNYDSDWHTAPDGDEGGISLELINNTLICGVSDNWGSSIASNGGTPGMTNSIANNSPDLTGPALYDFAGYMSEFSLVVYLSEPADEDDLTASNFTLNGGLIIDEIEYFEEELALIITVNPSTPLVFGEGYMLTCNSLFDCQGNESTNLQVSFTFYASPEFGDIIINEIMAAPSSSTPSPNEEYIEIINRSSTSTFDLSALRINNGYFGEQVIIAPGEYLIVTDDDNLGDFIAFPNAVGMNSFPQLTNSGTTVSMTLGGSVLIDKVSYDDTWYHDVDKDEGGWSLELINPNDPCSDASNWTASNHFSGATPGTVNSVFDDSPDVVPPSVGRVLVLDSQTIQVEVIEPIDTLALAPEAFTLFDAAGNELGWEVVALSFPGQRIQAVFSEEFWPGAVFELVITELSDCWGNEAEVAVKFGLPAEPGFGDQ